MILDCPAKFHNEKILNKYCMVSKTVCTGMVRHLKILLSKAKLVPGADPGFWSEGPSGVLTPGGGLSPKFAQNCLKTAWLWKHLGGSGGLGPQGPLDPCPHSKSPYSSARANKAETTSRGNGNHEKDGSLKYICESRLSEWTIWIPG